MDTEMKSSGVPPPYSEPQFHPGPQPGPHPGPPPPQMVASVTVVPGAVVTAVPAMGPQPQTITCSSCHAQVVTRVDYNSTMKTHLIALLLCVFGCWPCACIPYCTDSCRNADHHCPNCQAYIGSYVR